MCVINEDTVQLCVEFMTFFDNLFHYKYVVDCGSVGRNPIWQSSNLFSTILVNLLFIRIEEILYTTFRRVKGL